MMRAHQYPSIVGDFINFVKGFWLIAPHQVGAERTGQTVQQCRTVYSKLARLLPRSE